MKDLRTDIYLFSGCCLVLWTALGILLMRYDKGWLHLALQLPHNTLTDTFFRYYSSFAEWLLYVFMLLPLCFGKWRQTVAFGAAEGLSAIVVQTIKHIWNMPRPVTWFTEQFGNADMLPLVDGVRMHAWHSFPSGHTATFFAFFTMAVVLWGKEINGKWRETGHRVSVAGCVFAASCFVLAAAGGYSRIYLSQHFALDVLVGSIIGTLSALAIRDKLFRTSRGR